MAKPVPGKDVHSAFREVVSTMHPLAGFSSLGAKKVMPNTRLLLPPEAGQTGVSGGVVLKIKRVVLASIPKSKFVPIVFSTQKKGRYLVGTRLTPHGGEVAVELARRLARKATMRLVVLGTNIIIFTQVDVLDLNGKGIEGRKASVDLGTGVRQLIESILRRSSSIAEEFNARIGDMLG